MASWYNPPVQYVPWERDIGTAHFKGSNMAKIVASRFRSPRTSLVPVHAEVCQPPSSRKSIGRMLNRQASQEGETVQRRHSTGKGRPPAAAAALAPVSTETEPTERVGDGKRREDLAGELSALCGDRRPRCRSTEQLPQDLQLPFEEGEAAWPPSARAGDSAAWLAAMAASRSAYMALPTMFVGKALEEGSPLLTSSTGCSSYASEELIEPWLAAITAPSPLGSTDTLTTIGSGAQEAYGGHLKQLPNFSCWEYPLSTREKLDRLVLVAGKEADLSNERSEARERRARRCCEEAADLRAENAQLREVVGELRARLAFARHPARRAGQQGTRLFRLRRRLARRTELRLRRLRHEACEAALLAAELQQAREQIAAAQQESAWLRSQWPAGPPRRVSQGSARPWRTEDVEGLA